MICQTCSAPLDENHYAEQLIKIKNGGLAATITRSLGYICLDCAQGAVGGVFPKTGAPIIANPAPRRGRPRKILPPAQPCECGCGKLAKPGKRFLVGHATRGRKWKKGQRQKGAA
jgi:hypothetical protein